MRTQFTTRLPEPLASALATQAQANHRSANAELTAILRDALSGTPSTPDIKTALLHPSGAVTVTLTDGRQVYSPDGIKWPCVTAEAPTDTDRARVIARMVEPDLAPYKAALQRLIDDSAALREKYEDLDAAVEQARALL